MDLILYEIIISKITLYALFFHWATALIGPGSHHSECFTITLC